VILVNDIKANQVPMATSACLVELNPHFYWILAGQAKGRRRNGRAHPGFESHPAPFLIGDATELFDARQLDASPATTVAVIFIRRLDVRAPHARNTGRQ